MTKLLIARPAPPEVHEALEGFDVTYREDSAPLSEDEMQDALRDYDGVLATLGDRFTADVFGKVGMPRCKMLANFGVGYNHIDVEAAKAAAVCPRKAESSFRKITVASARGPQTQSLRPPLRASTHGSLQQHRVTGRMPLL